MTKTIDWGSRIGRRLRLRDLHIFFAVAECGSMAKAGAQLHVTQPAVSKAIGDLEAAVGAQLFDRSPHGVEPTVYGQALLKCGIAVFDELRQGVLNIEHLADPTAGELRIGAQQTFAATVLPPIIEEFAVHYPRVNFHVTQLVSPTFAFPELHDRTVDLVLVALPGPPGANRLSNDLKIDILFEDRLFVVTGARSRWARRDRVELSELVGEPWIVAPPGSWQWTFLAEAFRAKNLDMPRIKIATYSVPLTHKLAPTGRFIWVTSGFVLTLLGKSLRLKALPIDLPVWPRPAAIVTLKNRTLSPIVTLFTEHVRAFVARHQRRYDRP